MNNKTKQNRLPLWKIAICILLSILLSFYAFQANSIKAFAFDNNEENDSGEEWNENINANDLAPVNPEINNENNLGVNSSNGKRHYEFTDPKTGIKYVFDYPWGTPTSDEEKWVQNTVKKYAEQKEWDEKKTAIKKAALSSITDVANGFFKAAMIDENGKFKFDAKVMIEVFKDAGLAFISAGLEAFLGPLGGVAGSILTGAVNWMIQNLQNIGKQACKPNPEAYVMSRDTGVILDTMNIKISALETKLNSIAENVQEIKELLRNQTFSRMTTDLFDRYEKISKHLTWKLFNRPTQKETELFKGVSEYKMQFKTDAQGKPIKGDDGLYIVDEDKCETIYTNFTSDLTPSIILNTSAQYKKDVIDKKENPSQGSIDDKPTTKQKVDDGKIDKNDNSEALAEMSSKMLNFYNANVFNNTDRSAVEEKWIFDLKQCLVDTKKTLYIYDWQDGGSRCLFNDYADLLYLSLVNNGIDRKTAAETTIDKCDALGLKFINTADLCTRLLDFYFTYETLSGKNEDSAYDQKLAMQEILGVKDAKKDEDKGFNLLISERTDEIREKYSNILKAKVTDVEFQGKNVIPVSEIYYESFDEAWKAASQKIKTNSSGSHAITVTLLDNLNADLRNGFAKEADKNDKDKGFINNGCLFVNSNKAPGCSLTLDLNGYSICTYENGETKRNAWSNPIFCLDCPYGKTNDGKASGYETCTSTFNLINSQYGAKATKEVPIANADEPNYSSETSKNKNPATRIEEAPWPDSKIIAKNGVIAMRGRQGNPDQWTPINCSISGIKFEKCEARVINWLGGILASSYSQKENTCKLKGYDNLSIKNCKFENITGGVINTFWYAHYNIENTEFINCKTAGSGAAINSSCTSIPGYQDSESYITPINKTTYRVIPKFDRDYQIDGSKLNGKLNVNDPNYYNQILSDKCEWNYAPMKSSCKQDVYTCENGGVTSVMWNKYKSDMCNIIKNCTFTNLEAGCQGGALALNTSTYLRDCKFEKCTSNGGKGGAIVKVDEDFFTICAENCSFKSCKTVKKGNSSDGVYSEGGAICMERINNSDTELPNAQRIFDLEGRDIVNGKTGASGCDFYLDRGYPVYGLYLKQCQLEGNEAVNGKGGSIYSCGFAVKCENCAFNNSIAGIDGSATYITHPKREATTQDWGWEAPSSFYSCQFNGCDAQKGSGTLFFYDDSGVIGAPSGRTTITNCKSKGNGSAIMMSGATTNRRYHWTNFKRNDLVLYNADITNNYAGGIATVFLNNTMGYRYNNDGVNNNVFNNVNISNNTTGGDSVKSGVYCEAWGVLNTYRGGSRMVYSNVELGGVINLNNNHQNGSGNMGGIYLAGNTSAHRWTSVKAGNEVKFNVSKSRLPGMGSMSLSDSSNIIISTQYSSSVHDKYLGEGFSNNLLKVFKPYAGDGGLEIYLNGSDLRERKPKKKGK